jgi:putative FmdB family regulatory protein
MPLYEYKCSTCNDVFEIIQKFSDEPLHEHPGCGGPVERLVSAPSLQFKGTGWYVTDYGRNGSFARDKSKAESGDSKESKKTESSDGKKAESSDSKKTETSKPAATSTKETSTVTKSE